jgi:hypothetical protein
LNSKKQNHQKINIISLYSKQTNFSKGIEEVKNIRIEKIFPDEPLKLLRISVIYMLDCDKNGKFSLQDLFDFAEFVSKIASIAQPGNLRQELEAQCTLCMWKQVSTEKGQKAFVEWCCRLFSCRMRVKVDHYENTSFVSSDIIPTVHDLFQIKDSYELTPQDLTTLLQRVGEENGIMKLEDVKLDNVVPLECIKIFSKFFTDGFLEMMKTLGFEREKFIKEEMVQPNPGELEILQSDSDKEDYTNDVSTEEEEEEVESDQEEIVITTTNPDSPKKKILSALKKGKSMKKIERRSSERLDPKSGGNSPQLPVVSKSKNSKILKASQSFFVTQKPKEEKVEEKSSPEKTDLLNKINLVSMLKTSKQAKRSFGELDDEEEKSPKLKSPTPATSEPKKTFLNLSIPFKKK